MRKARTLVGPGAALCYVCGNGCDLRQASLSNSSGDRTRMVFADHVKILAEIELFERGRITIGSGTFIGRSKIFCAEKVDIGAGCWIADNVFIMDSDLHSTSMSRRVADAFSYTRTGELDYYTGIPTRPVRIETGAWIGAGAIILKGVTLFEGCIVGAGSVVTKDVPSRVIVAGNPARPIGRAAD